MDYDNGANAQLEAGVWLRTAETLVAIANCTVYSSDWATRFAREMGRQVIDQAKSMVAEAEKVLGYIREENCFCQETVSSREMVCHADQAMSFLWYLEKLVGDVVRLVADCNQPLIVTTDEYEKEQRFLAANAAMEDWLSDRQYELYKDDAARRVENLDNWYHSTKCTQSTPSQWVEDYIHALSGASRIF